jgi:WD40 repeat protein
MIRKTNNLIHPITNLCIDDINNVLFASSGSGLISTVISINNANYNNNISSTLNIYDNFSIQGLKIVNNNNLIVFGNNSLNIYNYNVTNDNKLELFEIFKLQNLSDLILDCDIIYNNDNIILVIGYAHNFIDIIDLSEPFSLKSNKLQSNQLSQHVYRICCSENCMLFSMSMNIIHDNDNNKITIASGTAFGRIILWNIEFSNIDYSQKISNLSSSLLPKVTSLKNTSFLLPSLSNNVDDDIPKSHIINSLLDHEGVIFNIRWSKNKKYILTVSDDRTVRMWDVIEGKK